MKNSISIREVIVNAMRPRRDCPCSQSLNGKTVEVLVNPRGLSVDILNDDTGGLLRTRASGHAYAVRLTHEAEANNNPRTEALTVSLFFGLSNVGKSY